MQQGIQYFDTLDRLRIRLDPLKSPLSEAKHVVQGSASKRLAPSAAEQGFPGSPRPHFAAHNIHPLDAKRSQKDMPQYVRIS